jgi:hypothetical protein
MRELGCQCIGDVDTAGARFDAVRDPVKRANALSTLSAADLGERH